MNPLIILYDMTKKKILKTIIRNSKSIFICIIEKLCLSGKKIEVIEYLKYQKKMGFDRNYMSSLILLALLSFLLSISLAPLSLALSIAPLSLGI